MTKQTKPTLRWVVVVSLVGFGVAALVTVGSTHWPVRAFETRLVSTFGDDLGGTNDCSSPDQPCLTIQNAINQSSAGDFIELAPGTYFENVNVTADVTIQGDFTLGATVNGGNAGPVFTLGTGISASLSGLTITSGNSAGGGGIANDGTLTINGCTISGNAASNAGMQAGTGGGIHNTRNLTVINSTISGNSAGTSGGGIWNDGASAVATIVNSTINGNSSTSGGGVFNDSGATLNLTNTIVAGSQSGGDCHNAATIGTNLNNLIQDGSCSPAVSGDPKLGSLQDNGGPTFTHALLAGSPAINAGDDSVLGDPFNLEFDQRSFGFPRRACAHVDIGAYEFGSSTPPTISCPGNISAVTDPGQNTATVSFTVTASELCDGSIAPVCKIGDTVITSPHSFPVGVTPVSCSATNSAGLTASCSFNVSVILLNVCIQDDSSRDTLRFNSMTGQYQFTRCATGFTLSGTGTITIKGSIITLQHNAADRRVLATIDNGFHRGTASVQVIPLRTTFTIADRNTLNDTCLCQ